MFTPSPSDVQQAMWLRTARQSKGLYVHQLAAKIDVNPGRVSNWENLQRRIPAHLMERIKTVLN